MKVDLHIHTNCSDGSDDWKTVLQKAEQLGLKYISITDHNNVDAYFQMQNLEKYFTGKIINGIEPECYYKGRFIELLGYGIDVEIMRGLLKDAYSPAQTVYNAQFEKAYTKLAAGGVKFSDDVLSTWDKKKHHYPTCHLHADLVKYPENRHIITDDESWNNSIQFFRNHISRTSSPFYVDDSEHYPSAETICKFIRQAGGRVFIPHIFLYGDESICLLKDLVKDFQIGGVECFYSSFTKEQTDYLLAFCKENNLHVSAGSDYHGTHRPNIKLGVDNERFDDLLKWLK